ncbi:MAG: hypothetical protein Ct9H300mP18_06280 [Candidatus Neomarinimicrobiota bacterium]|nr:MAG: hypothetical protein Ct9H300mP18_06280 [Candidatus Neomarinimicrobiota bacterium]
MGFLYKLSLNKYFLMKIIIGFLPTILKNFSRCPFLDWDLYDKYFINGFGRVKRIFSKLTGRMDYDGLDQILVDG